MIQDQMMSICVQEKPLMSERFPLGDEFNIVITDNESVYSMQGILVSASIETLLDNSAKINMVFSGTDAEMSSIEDFSRGVVIQRMADEWYCPYCGSMNELEERYCGEHTTSGCGAVRPFILE